MDELEFLNALKEYIEGAEVQIDGEFGLSRSLDDLIAEGEMPPIYDEVLRRLAANDLA